VVRRAICDDGSRALGCPRVIEISLWFSSSLLLAPEYLLGIWRVCCRCFLINIRP
jgi:hypothetical protein